MIDFDDTTQLLISSIAENYRIKREYELNEDAKRKKELEKEEKVLDIEEK